MIGNKGQAEVMDGLILMLIAATCSIVLLSISANYGLLPTQIYEETYAHKLAQNSLLSLYHITYLSDTSSPYYKKSIMVAVSSQLSGGSTDLRTSEAGSMIRNVLDMYEENLGWHFMFALTSGNAIIDNSVIATDTRVTDAASFKENVGAPFCASAALTYPNTGSCSVGGSAGNMCYAIFEVCVWQA